MRGIGNLRNVAHYGLTIIMGILGLDLLWVLFWGGINIQLGGIAIRSTTIEFPTISFLCAFVLLLIVQRKEREALLLCSSLLLSCLIGEVLLRVLDHPLSKAYVDYVAWYEPSDLFGHQIVPNFEGIGPLNLPIKINSKGFRDVEHSFKKERDTIRILGLGDSFTMGWGVAFEETYLRQLEKYLTQASGKRVETINTGVPGWGLNQYYLYLKKIGMRYSPDVIVLAYFTDDLPPAILEAIPGNQQYRAGLQYKGGILHHSRFYNFAKSLADQIRRKNRTTRIAYLHDLDPRREEWAKHVHYLMYSGKYDEEKYIRLLHEYFRRIHQIALKNDATLVVMFIPDLSQFYHKEAQYINRLLEEVSQQYKIPFVDMTPIFEQASDLSTYYLWPQDGHTNARGHEKMAQALTELICPALKSKNIACHAVSARVLPAEVP